MVLDDDADDTWSNQDDWDAVGWDAVEDNAWNRPVLTWLSGPQRYNEDCIAAIRGERVPDDIWNTARVIQICVLRGIRHHHGFATELRNTEGLRPEFIRTFHARDIMSDIIPDIKEASEFPYCIWYPDVASEATYRALASRYPQMRYQCGRACAVAGYDRLYQDLNLKPDVSIAEEARDNRQNPGSQRIFDLIIQQSILWRIMDDYTRSIRPEQPQERVVYGLNGDACVRSTLELGRSFEEHGFSRPSNDGSVSFRCLEDFHPPPYFNITEDWQISEGRLDPETTPSGMDHLLWSPLPFNLPEGNKDVLVYAAAYYGDIDRYVRLRRPGSPWLVEAHCIVRGIYHNTLCQMVVITT